MLRGFGRYNSYTEADGGRRFSARASSGYSTPPILGYGGAGAGGGPHISGFSATSAMAPIPMMEGIINTNDLQLLHRIWRDVYHNQAVAGMAVDLMAALAFGDNFSLKDIDDHKILDSYIKNVENIKCKTLLPLLATEYQVIGAFIGSLNWDKDKRIFNSISPQNISHTELMAVPIFGASPLITLNFPPELVAALSSPDPRMREALTNLPNDFKNAVRSRKLPLDPDSTIFLSRGTQTPESYGTSYYRRILPYYIMEKALMRGTIDQAYRRQRPITIVQIGDDQWAPNEEEISGIASAISSADADPVSAVLAFRSGVQLSEFKEGASFWKISDSSDYINSAILQALGISADLISGAATVASADTAMSMFVESVRAFRDRITRELFYDKIFPIIAVTNDFFKPRRISLGSNEKESIIWQHFNTRMLKIGEQYEAHCSDSIHNTLSGVDDITKYWMPTIHWHRSLRPEMDANLLQFYQELQTLGLPIPIATIAAAGNMSIDEIVRGLDEDLKIRGKIADYQKQLTALTPQQNQQTASVIKELARTLAGANAGSTARHGFRKIEDDTDQGPFVRNNHGKYQKLSAKGQKVTDEQMMKMLARSMARVNEKQNAEIKREEAR